MLLKSFPHARWLVGNVESIENLYCEDTAHER